MGTPVEKFIRDAHKRFNVKYALTTDRLRAIRTKLKLADIQGEVQDSDTSLALDIVLADYGMGSATMRTANSRALLDEVLDKASPPFTDKEKAKIEKFIVTKINGAGKIQELNYATHLLFSLLEKRGVPKDTFVRLHEQLMKDMNAGESLRNIKMNISGSTRTATATSPMGKEAHPGIRNAGMCPRCSHSMQFAKLADSEETRYCTNCHVCELV